MNCSRTVRLFHLNRKGVLYNGKGHSVSFRKNGTLTLYCHILYMFTFVSHCIQCVLRTEHLVQFASHKVPQVYSFSPLSLAAGGRSRWRWAECLQYEVHASTAEHFIQTWKRYVYVLWHCRHCHHCAYKCHMTLQTPSYDMLCLQMSYDMLCSQMSYLAVSMIFRSHSLSSLPLFVWCWITNAFHAALPPQLFLDRWNTSTMASILKGIASSETINSNHSAVFFL